jgi:hypothetical protein
LVGAGAASTLAKSTAGLQRVTGMDTKAASAWVSMTKERGIETAALNKSMVKFAQFSQQVNAGGKQADDALSQLNISAGKFVDASMQDRIGMVADAFKGMEDPAQKAALAQQLFGKQGQALMPILAGGSAGINDQLKAMDKYGLTLDEKGKKKALDLAKAQREMRSSMDGLKVSIGTSLIPVITTLAQALVPIVTGFGQLLKDCPALTYVIIGLAAAFAALMIVSQVAAAISLLANPITLVVLGIAALAAGLVIAYQKVGWFHDAVDATFGFLAKIATTAFNAVVTAGAAAFNWIKSNWPLLLGILTGPFGLAIALIVTHFGKIKQTAVDAFNAIKTAVTDAAGAVSGTFVGAFNAVKGAVQGVVDTVSNLIQKVKDIPSGALDKLKGGGVPFIPGIQHGTPYFAGGLALVGEAGPELIDLPRGSRVTPLQAGTQAPVDLAGWGGDIHVHLDVDGRELAHVVARQTADQVAAR